MGKLFKRKEPDSEEGTSNISPDNEESKGQLKKAKKDSSAVDARAPSLTVAEAGQQKVQKLKENGGAPSLRRSSRNFNVSTKGRRFSRFLEVSYEYFMATSWVLLYDGRQFGSEALPKPFIIDCEASFSPLLLTRATKA